MNVKEKLINVLKEFGFPVYLQGSFGENEALPDSFFTFWNFGNPEDLVYNNRANRASHDYGVYLYSTDPMIVHNVSREARLALIDAGFHSNTLPHDIPSGEKTHTGTIFMVKYVEYY